MVYKWYILPIGGLYATYHLLGEPETTIESTCQMMIGVYDHFLSKVFRFHYHSQKVIGSLGHICESTENKKATLKPRVRIQVVHEKFAPNLLAHFGKQQLVGG